MQLGSIIKKVSENFVLKVSRRICGLNRVLAVDGLRSNQAKCKGNTLQGSVSK